MEITTVVNENNNFSISELEYTRKLIENMDKFNQTEILKIIYENNPNCINENNYGIYINLTELDTEIIQKLNSYIKYVNIQENEINNVEKQKEEYINDFFTN
jgi:hypothetical protein